MIANFTNTPPLNVRETINWLIRLGRPPLPECPIEAAKQGKDPKQPCFLDGHYLKSVNWKQWQNNQPIEEIYNAWFKNPKTGIGTLGGWNGNHWLGWIDFDQKDFDSAQDCDRSIANWLEQYPLMKDAPMFRTPSGGYRFLVAFNREPENFKANSGFSLKSDGSHHVGELLSKNGGHTLLPPTIGVSGKAYQWVQWSEYPPIVEQPEDVGLYPVHKKTEAKPHTTRVNDWTGGTTLTDLLQREIYPRLSLEQAFNWHGHDFKQQGNKLKGSCPWHDSQSGTAFYAEIKNGSPVWRCPACEIGGGVIEYRHRLGGGSGSPRGTEFVALVKELASEVGVTIPERDFGGKSGNPRTGGSGGEGGYHGNEQLTKFPGFAPLTVEQVTEKIDELINRGVTKSQLTGELNRLAAASQIYIGELRKLYYERLEESTLEGERDSHRTEIENLLHLNDQSLDLADYLPPSLAQPITQWCTWLNIRPAVALTAMLAGISSVHKTGTELVLQRNQNFRVPSTIYAALVSPSGQKKSPIFHNIIRRSLNTLEKEKLTAYEAAMEDYEVAMQQWEKTKEGEKPKKPKNPPIYYFTNATGEAIPVQAAAYPHKTLLALIDELAGYFNSSNAYRNGRGSDKQDLLSYFDGSGQTILRASGVRVNLKNIYLSIFGTIQPEILKRHMDDCSDPDGNWARFLFVNQPLQAATLHDDDGMAVQISDRLTDFYRRIDQLPVMEYRLSPQAFKRYQKIYNQLERLRVTHPQSGMAAVYSKMEGYIGRLALNLHVLWELDAGKACPNEEIPLFIMEMAISLAKFYMGQVKLMHANADEESLPIHIVKLIELSQRLERNGRDGWIKAKQVQELFAKKKRPSAQQIRNWMNEAIAMGYGTTRGNGNRLEYYWRCDNNTSPDDSPLPQNLGDLGNTWGTLGEPNPQGKTTVYQAFPENLGNLGKGIPKLEEDNPPGGNDPKLRKNDTPQLESPPPEFDLEGDSVPQPSPTLPQERCDAESTDVSGWVNNLGNPSPTLPQVPQVCDSSAGECEIEEVMISPATVTLSPAVEAQDNEELIRGEAVGRMVHIRNLKREVSGESWKIVKWCDRNGYYTLENGETFYPAQLILAQVNFRQVITTENPSEKLDDSLPEVDSGRN